MQSDKMTDLVSAAGYSTGVAGLGISTWFAHSWLMVLSGLGIVITIWLGYRNDKRQKEKLQILRDRADD